MAKGKTITSVGAGYKDKRGNTMSTKGQRFTESKVGSKSASEFTPCSRCPNPASCMKAGKCLAESF